MGHVGPLVALINPMNQRSVCRQRADFHLESLHQELAPAWHDLLRLRPGREALAADAHPRTHPRTVFDNESPSHHQNQMSTDSMSLNKDTFARTGMA